MTVKKDFPYGDHCAIIIQIDGKSKKTDKALLEFVNSATNQISLLPTNLSSGLVFAKEVLDKTGQEVQTNAESALQLRLKTLVIQPVGGDVNPLLQIDTKASNETN